jgi:PAS domain S-box-containing protein
VEDDRSDVSIPKWLSLQLMDEISDGVYILDSDWRFAYLNRRALEYFGRESSDLVGQVLWDIFPTKRGTQFEEQFRRAVREAVSLSFTTQSVATPGRWLELRAHPFEGGLVVLFLDVTERESALSALRRSEGQLRLIVDAAPTLISYIDRHYRYQLVNKTYEQWFERSANEIVGSTVRDVVGDTVWQVVGPKLARVMQGETVSFEAEALYPKGPRWVMATYTPHFDPSGAVVGAMILVADVSAQKRIEQELRDSEAYHRLLFDAVGVGNSEVESETRRFLRVNRQYCEMFGYSEHELLNGMTVDDITHPDDRESTRKEIASITSGKTQQFQLEKRYFRKDGTVMWGHVSVTCLRDADGRVTRLLGVVHDITERKEAEEELRRTAEELIQINEVVPVGIWVSRDPMCAVITGNSAAQRLYESRPGENVSRGPAHSPGNEPKQEDMRRRFFDSTGRELSASELPMQQAVLRNAEIRDQLVTFQQPSGRILTMLGSAVPLRDQSGGVRGCVGAFMDVTARVEAERALRESEERLRLAVTAAGVGYWSWNPKSDSYVMDETCARMFRVEGVGTFEDIRAVLFVEDIPKMRQAVDDALAFGQPYRAEFRVHDGAGGWRWLASLGDVQRDDTGNPLRMFGVTIDITDRRHTEEERQKFVSLVENSTEFVGMCDLNGRPLFLNEAGMRLVGLADLAEARRTHIREFFFEEDHEFVLNEFLPAVLREGRGEVEIRFRHFRTGEPRWMIHNVFPLRDSDNKTMGFGTVSRDITERRHTEQMLKEADRRKDEFLATLAHELRNPLAPISNALEIWPRVEKDPAQAARIREMMERQVKQLKRLIDDLLDVSRISRGKIQLRTEKVELSAILEGAIEAIRPFVDACRHRLKVELPNYPVTVEGDIGRLTQVFGNLIHNAAKYTDPCGLIRISADVHDDRAFVRVKDNGSGIPQEMLESIFDAFTQVNLNLDRAQGGLGIGLTLVKTLVEMHGGTVFATSEGPGLGSEFVVTLPLVTRSGKGAPRKTLPEHQRTHGARALTRRRVLVVDDVKPSADTLAMMLEELGQEARVAYDGVSALQLADEFKPDVVFSDVAMPGLDGYGLARRLGATDGKKPLLVALTGYGQERDRARAHEAGFSHHLVKPTDLESLHHVLTLP